MIPTDCFFASKMMEVHCNPTMRKTDLIRSFYPLMTRLEKERKSAPGCVDEAARFSSRLRADRAANGVSGGSSPRAPRPRLEREALQARPGRGRRGCTPLSSLTLAMRVATIASPHLRFTICSIQWSLGRRLLF